MTPAPIDSASHADARCRLIHAALAPFVEELRLLDCDDLVGHVMRGQFANLEDLVHSSLELFFAPGAVAFGWGAGVAFAWDAAPVVTLDMEFCAGGATVFFVLSIAARSHDVEIRSIAFDSPDGDPRRNTGRLALALAQARAAGERAS